MAIIDIRRHMSRRYRWHRLVGTMSVFAFGFVYYILKKKFRDTNMFSKFFTNNEYIFENENRHGRIILSDAGGLTKCQADFCMKGNESGQSQSSEFPDDLFTEDQREKGAIILHILGMFYMFVGLAVVCDEFFVPALGVITDKLSLTEDVAGATFMAAGGSAPELFTSLFGTVLIEGDVGIGTIVGSAVFNILFVIGMCSFFSKGLLTLTWWPLFRDICFYSVSLIMLVIWFRDEVLEWYESLSLFLWYVAYAVFMKYNLVVERNFKKLLGKCFKKDFAPAHVPHERRKSTLPLVGSQSMMNRQRKSIAEILFHPENKDSVDIQGKRQSTYKSTHSSTGNSVPLNNNAVTEHRQSRDSPSVGINTSADLQAPSSHIRKDSSADMIPEAAASAGSNADPEQSDTGIHWGQASVTNTKVSKENETHMSEEPETPLDMSFPEGLRERITYILVFPLTFLLWITLPDVRRPEKEKWYLCTFVGSILWIGGYSYLMVWWANTTAQTVGIPVPVIGLTILAMGTSVPDLITSVIVARKGFGDMAVSSSIGSNIFDITIGLPIPWLLYSAKCEGAGFKVKSKGLLCSIGLLFLMLISVVTSIALSGWKMHKMLGVVMMCLYVVFLVMAILLEIDVITCDIPGFGSSLCKNA